MTRKKTPKPDDSLFTVIPDDGHTRPAYVGAERGIHGPLRFSYRPMTAEARGVALQKLQKLEDPHYTLAIAGILEGQLVEWDAAVAGKAIPVRQSAIRRLAPTLLFRVWGIVLGTEPSDVDPDWDDPLVEEEAAVLAEVVPPETVGEVREEADLGNSGEG